MGVQNDQQLEGSYSFIVKVKQYRYRSVVAQRVPGS